MFFKKKSAVETLAKKENDGEKIRKTMALKLIDKGMLIPAGDGLFGDTQTYKAAEGF